MLSEKAKRFFCISEHNPPFQKNHDNFFYMRLASILITTDTASRYFRFIAQMKTIIRFETSEY